MLKQYDCQLSLQVVSRLELPFFMLVALQQAMGKH